MIEVWKDIVGYEGLYKVSNLGSVWSCRLCRLLKQQTHRKGYKEVKLRKDDAQTIHKVHRLVAKAFIPNPLNLPQVNHKDEHKDNNQMDNLEWCNQSYNIQYGTGNKRRSITAGREVEQLTLGGEHVAYYHGAREADRATGIHNVRHVCDGRRQTAGGYKWRYVS